MPVQFITVGGEEIAILPRAEYEQLVAVPDEDAGTARVVARARTALAEGREITVPMEVANRLADGENAVRVLRKWRGLGQNQLAAAAGVAQGFLSDIENGRRTGSAETLGAIARALSVPLDMLVG